jgi:transposase
MPRPYALDLRKRVVKAYLSGGGTLEEISKRFDVGVATVDRWVSRQRRTGSVAPDPMGGWRHGKFDQATDATVAKIVEADVDVTRVELVRRLRDELGLRVSPSAVQRSLERLKLTRRKRRFTRRSATPNE